MYELKGLVLFNREVLVIRESSISTFMEIDFLQYTKERKDNQNTSIFWSIMGDTKSRISIGTGSIEEGYGQEESTIFHYNNLV